MERTESVKCAFHDDKGLDNHTKDTLVHEHVFESLNFYASMHYLWPIILQEMRQISKGLKQIHTSFHEDPLVSC